MQWSRRETKTLKLQQATEELAIGRERTARVTTMACMVLYIVANQIVEQREAEKNGQERAHASTSLTKQNLQGLQLQSFPPCRFETL